MKERELALRVAGEGFLGSYLAYARTVTAAPLIYHLATGLSIIAGAIGSNVAFVGAGDTEYWPNQYSLLLGKSGMHKTTAMNVGLEVLRRAAPGTLYSDQYSQEQFIIGLRDRPNRLLAVEEFATLLSDMERSYMVGLKETLTKLYDPRQEFVRSLRGEGDVRVSRPSITILGASTIDWLVAHLKEVDFVSGFMPRFLLWPSETKEADPGALARGDRLERDALVQQLHALHQIRPPRGLDSRPVEIDAAAVKRIKTLGKEHQARHEQEGGRKELDGLVSRVGNYCAKLCTLLVLADQGPQERYVVTGAIAERGAALMDWLVESAVRLFDEAITFDKFEREAQSMLRLIPDTGALWSDALKRSHKPSNQFALLIGTLKERGQVREDTKPTAGRSGRYLYRCYPDLTASVVKDGKDREVTEKKGEKEGRSNGRMASDEWADAAPEEARMS